MIISIDPGPTKSALLYWTGSVALNLRYEENESILEHLRSQRHTSERMIPLVIEKIASYGMAVGAEIFETCVWTGRFMEAYGAERTYRITRNEVKNHICHSSRAKDTNIRMALIDRFGAPGTKHNKGPLYGVSGDLWAALAVSVTFWDTRMGSLPVSSRVAEQLEVAKEIRG